MTNTLGEKTVTDLLSEAMIEKAARALNHKWFLGEYPWDVMPKMHRDRALVCARAALEAVLPEIVEECAKVARTFKRPVPPRPTIAELEAILQEPDAPMVEIAPDGSVVASGTHDGQLIAELIRALVPHSPSNG